MSRTLRILFGLCLILGLLLPVSNVDAAKGGPKPTPTPPPTPEPTLAAPWTAPTDLADHGCSLGNDLNGSETLFCKPAARSGGIFTATLVIFAHGYVNPYFPPKQLPWDQLIFKGPIFSGYHLV